MVRLGLRTLTSASAALIVGIATASAEPIRITSGSLVYPGSPDFISVDFAGDGFTFAGKTARDQIAMYPYLDCRVPACLPGTTVNLHTGGTEGNYAFVTVNYQGETFDNFGGIDARSHFVTEWSGSLDLPSDFAGGTLSAPFSFSSEFLLSRDLSGNFQRIQLFGSGIATLVFGPYGIPEFPNAFTTQSLRFDFTDVAATPEPASLLLLGTGLCGIAAARRRART